MLVIKVLLATLSTQGYIMHQSLFSIRATYIALSLYCAFGIFVGISNFFLNTGHLIDFVVPVSCGVCIAGLLIYFHKDPKGRHLRTIKALFFLNAYSFLTPAWYFTIGSALNGWVLVDEFPPISGVTLIATSVLVMMVPKSWLRYTMIVWFAICAPIVAYLITHSAELDTARGKEMMVFFGPGGGLFLIVLSYQRDLILRFEQIEERLQHTRRQADYDELTNICNRRGLIDWLSNNAGAEPNVSGLIIDIDYFKHINDTYGHETGDAVLKQVSKLLGECLPDQSCLARWGGDEFVILLNEQSTGQAEQVANTCWQLILDKHFPLVGHITCSVGVASNVESNDIDTIIRNADACLYAAKRQGRNQVMNNRQLETVTE